MSNQLAILPQNTNEAMQLANVMAQGGIMMPAHFKNDVASCMGLVIQAGLVGISPFALAQKTHVIQGRLCYESQLIIALVQQSGAIRGAFRYEYKNEGTDSLECRCGAVLNGDDSITWGSWLSIKNVQVKNSPLWKTNPAQQLSYLQAKNFSRLYCPGAILGMYSDDEFEVVKPAPKQEKEIKIFDIAMAQAKEYMQWQGMAEAIAGIQQGAYLSRPVADNVLASLSTQGYTINQDAAEWVFYEFKRFEPVAELRMDYPEDRGRND